MATSALELSAPPRRGPRTWWATVRAGFGAALGMVPHVLHHVGLIAGTALLTGALGNGVLYVVGLLLSIPLLRRLRSRFGTGWAPALGVVAFTALFALSAFVIGPLFNPATPNQPDTPSPAASASASGTEDHEGHHSASPTP